MKLNTLFAAVIFFCTHQVAVAEVVTRCGASAGHEYYFAGGPVTAKQAGWTAGTIDGGSTVLMRNGNQFDIVFSDALGRNMSIAEDGGTPIVISKADGTIVLVVDYPGRSVETWIFKLNDVGRGEVTFSQARYNGTISKHSLFRAACEKYTASKK
jgi:hypothetical protein